MLSQTASDAVIVALRRPLNWANTVTWPVRLTARLVRIEGLTQMCSSPHTPPPACAARERFRRQKAPTASSSGAVTARSSLARAHLP
jgi:hypothetical protein